MSSVPSDRIHSAGEAADPGDRSAASELPSDLRTARADLRQLLSGVAERVDEAIAAAERSAADIRRRAEAEAERLVAERRRELEIVEAERSRRFQEALEALRSGIDAVDRESARAVRAAEDAIHRAERPAVEPAQTPRPADTPLPPPVAYPGRSREAPEGAVESPEARTSMLIRATQLAVQGHERAEIEETLASEFGAADVGQIVDEVLGRR
jgi:translation initiation factor IF-2